MIYVTHDQVEAMTLADRIVVLYKGKSEQWARPLELYNTPATTCLSEFIGTPKINVLASGHGVKARCISPITSSSASPVTRRR
ncbi:hypothetical protein [Enterobacter sp. RHBSTW-01064]|uniref:hypothetical protein n=1 Tax=Enterobacter sp. RHBSTW-01064 TaxID=2742679 RepID=UPI0020177B6F|nr:hypothetical protein [Enterobacter sp. RHBSTW-01064]